MTYSHIRDRTVCTDGLVCLWAICDQSYVCCSMLRQERDVTK